MKQLVYSKMKNFKDKSTMDLRLLFLISVRKRMLISLQMQHPLQRDKTWQCQAVDVLHLYVAVGEELFVECLTLLGLTSVDPSSLVLIRDDL